MTGKLAVQDTKEIASGDLVQVGQIANQVAASHVFDDYRSRKSENTIRRQDADLVLFMRYLAGVGATPPGDMANVPEAWQGVTWGLARTFVEWQLQAGYAVSSVNVRLSTVKQYAKLAFQAGALGETEFTLIQSVSGYSHKEGKRINEAREEVGVKTRVGDKKSSPVIITPVQAEQLKTQQPDTPQGRRDALIMHLLLDHGLRASEIASLNVGDVDVKNFELKFYRSKVDRTQTHALSNGTLKAALAYIEEDALAVGPLLRGSRKDGRLHEAGMSARRITARVRVLGERVGIEGLSAHDCRHYLASRLAKTKTIKELMDIFGWSSPAMAIRYQVDAEVIQVE